MSYDLHLILCNFILLVNLMCSLPLTRAGCERTLDVVFILDSSPDVSDSDWSLMIKLTRDAASQLHPSEFGTHVALVYFAGYTTVVQGLETQLMTNSSTPDPAFGTGRNLSDALYETRRLVLDNTNGDRPEVPDVMVVVSHGPSVDRDATLAAAKAVKSEGIRIISVGIADTLVDDLREELGQIATDPESIAQTMLYHHSQYQSVSLYLAEEICKNYVEADSGSLRLVDGTANSGRLEVYVNEEWVTVCPSNWNDINTKIACKELGFPDGQAMYFVNQTSYFRRVGVDNIQCAGKESKLLECPHNSLFHVDSSCDHRQDVFVQCLCNDCDDYSPKDNILLRDVTSISGRLAVFSPESGWGGVCNHDWTPENTNVLCRELGFRDGAGTLESNRNLSVPLMLHNVSCVGNETSLFHCSYSTASVENCSHAVYIQCECKKCRQFVLQAPQLKEAVKGSTVEFYWNLSTEATSFAFQIISQKNPQTLLRVMEGNVVSGHTRFLDRVHLINVDNRTIGFTLTNVTTADMGTYALCIPEKRMCDFQAVLIVTGFIVVSGPDVIDRAVKDNVQVSWDLTALRRIGEISCDIFLTTPATGRVSIDYYYTNWLKNNPGRHKIPEHIDYLHPTVIIGALTPKDAGSYTISISVTSTFRQWMKTDRQISVDLRTVADDRTDLENCSFSLVTILVAALLLLSCVFNVFAGVLIHRYDKRRVLNGENRPVAGSQEMEDPGAIEQYYTVAEESGEDGGNRLNSPAVNGNDQNRIYYPLTILNENSGENGPGDNQSSQPSSPQLPALRSDGTPGTGSMATGNMVPTGLHQTPMPKRDLRLYDLVHVLPAFPEHDRISHIRIDRPQPQPENMPNNRRNIDGRVSPELEDNEQAELDYDEETCNNESPSRSQLAIGPQSQNEYVDRTPQASTSKETSAKNDADNTDVKRSRKTADSDGEETEAKHIRSSATSEASKDTDTADDTAIKVCSESPAATTSDMTQQDDPDRYSDALFRR